MATVKEARGCGGWCLLFVHRTARTPDRPSEASTIILCKRATPLRTATSWHSVVSPRGEQEARYKDPGPNSHQEGGHSDLTTSGFTKQSSGWCYQHSKVRQTSEWEEKSDVSSTSAGPPPPLPRNAVPTPQIQSSEKERTRWPPGKTRASPISKSETGSPPVKINLCIS